MKKVLVCALSLFCMTAMAHDMSVKSVDQYIYTSFSQKISLQKCNLSSSFGVLQFSYCENGQNYFYDPMISSNVIDYESFGKVKH